MILTIDDVRGALPPHLKSAATDNLVNALNNIQIDPEAANTIRENFIGYANVLKDGRFKMEDYLNAVAYVSFKIMGYTNLEAYSRTFPQRYQALAAKGTSSKDIAAYVAAYNKNKLVNLIYEQSLIPTHVLNADIFQKAINQQFDLMMNAKSEMVRFQAANSLMTHLKKPESKEMTLNIGIQEHDGMEDMKAMINQLAQQQQNLITSGVGTREIAHQKLVIDAEVVPE